MVCCRTEESLNNNNIIIIHIPVTKHQAKTDRCFVTGIIIINHTNFIVTVINFIAHRQTYGRMDRAIFLVKHMLTITKGQNDTIENLFILLQFSLQRTDKTNFIMWQFSQKLTDVQIFLSQFSPKKCYHVTIFPSTDGRNNFPPKQMSSCHRLSSAHWRRQPHFSSLCFHDDTFVIKKLPHPHLNMWNCNFAFNMTTFSSYANFFNFQEDTFFLI